MKLLISILGIVLVLLLAVFAFFFLFEHITSQNQQSQQNSGTTFPTSNTNTNSVVSSSNSSSLLQIKTQTGEIVTKNFITNGTTVPDIENKGVYFLAGPVGYCLKDGSCPAGASSTDFTISYDSTADFFTIALTKEPLAQSRIDAEAFLEKTLGMTPLDMCSLNYYLGTDQGVNPYYAGEELGFSFCSGAVDLPQ